MTVTVGGRPVVRVGPLDARPRTVPRKVLIAALEGVAADPAPTDELRELLSGTTDDFS